MQHGDMVNGDGGSPTPLLRFLGDQGKKSSKKVMLKDAIEHEIVSRDRVDMSTIGFEPKISSYIEAILHRGLISSSSSVASTAFSTGVCCYFLVLVVVVVVVVFKSSRVEHNSSCQFLMAGEEKDYYYYYSTAVYVFRACENLA